MNISRENKERIFVCAIFLLLSLVLIGATRVTHELRARRKSEVQERQHWQKTLEAMVKNIPLEKQEAWLKAAKNNPKLLLQATTSQFSKHTIKTN